MAKPKRKNKPGFVVRMDEDDYEAISIRSGKEGWKVATLFRDIVKRILKHDELAEELLKEHMADEGLLDDEE